MGKEHLIISNKDEQAIFCYGKRNTIVNSIDSTIFGLDNIIYDISNNPDNITQTNITNKQND